MTEVDVLLINHLLDASRVGPAGGSMRAKGLRLSITMSLQISAQLFFQWPTNSTVTLDEQYSGDYASVCFQLVQYE